MVVKIKSIIWFELYFVCFFGIFRDIFHLPASWIKLVDAITIVMLLFLFIQKLSISHNVYIFVGIILSVVLLSLVVFLIRDYSFSLFIDSMRYKYLVYIFFLTCVALLKPKDIIKAKRFFKTLFWINIVVCLVEYVMGYYGDFLGGTFGVIRGVNGYLNIIIVITMAIYVTEYFAKMVSLYQVIMAFSACMVIVAMGELKVVLFELIFIITLAMFFNGISFRKIVLVVFGTIAIIFGITLMGKIFSTSGMDFYTSGAIMRYMGANGYTGQGDFSRLNAIMRISVEFFRLEPFKMLFGYGLGYAYYGSSFFDRYQTLHYQWFADSFIYLESGILGMVLFEGFFVAVFQKCKKAAKKNYVDQNVKVMCQSATIVSLCAIVISFYDVSLLEKSSFMLYFFCALPLVHVTPNMREE